MRWLICLGVALIVLPFVKWDVASSDKQTPSQFNLNKRIPWTTSRIKGTPEPPPPYKTTVVYPHLKFSSPLDAVNDPKSDRIYVAERYGKIFSFVDDAKTKKANLVLDLEKTVYGIALHPKYQQNGFLYVTYVLDPNKTQPRGTRVSRFRVKGNPPRAERKSERIIIEWPSNGHNGGCLKFGPDGYLYIGTGDGSGIADSLETGQDLSDLLGAILRINVDLHAHNKLYSVPNDNPFVGMKNSRPEIWAYGLRQPWRFAFDEKTGDLWAGEVGQDLWEMVLRIEKGGNYGWSVQEGMHPFRPKRKRGPTKILPPIVEHSHTDFRSVTGGYIYHGQRLKDLTGAYIYGDFDTGRLWALRHDGDKLLWNKELVDTNYRVICFVKDNADEVLFVDFIGGQFHRLDVRPKTKVVSDFPRKLSETGLFTSTKDMTPAPGLIPYSVNSQLWGDHTLKERYIALPGKSQIEFDGVTYPQPSPGAPFGWAFPDGTVLVKTFFLEIERGNPKTKRRLETRILHFEKTPGESSIGDQVWHGYTYLWNDDETDAELVGAKGLNRMYDIRDSKKGKMVKQKYHFPSRAECTLCHTNAAKFALGVSTLQMNKEHDYGGVKANQLEVLEKLGVFTKPLPKRPVELPKLVDYSDSKQPLNLRARSYLHSNCAHCHVKWGGGNAEFQLLATLPLKDLGIVDVRPGQGDFDIPDARILAPGHPERSLIYHRMTKTGLGRMPHIATSIVDEPAAKLIHDWINGMR